MHKYTKTRVSKRPPYTDVHCSIHNSQTEKQLNCPWVSWINECDIDINNRLIVNLKRKGHLEPSTNVDEAWNHAMWNNLDQEEIFSQELAGWLRTFAALAVDQSLVPSTQVRQLSMLEHQFWGSQTSFWHLGAWTRTSTYAQNAREIKT